MGQLYGTNQFILEFCNHINMWPWESRDISYIEIKKSSSYNDILSIPHNW